MNTLWLFLKISACIAGLACLSQRAASKPNIVFIMSDDHTWQAIGSYGSHLKEVAPTANIDRLADEGILLKNVFCTNSICTPSRATILSGQYSHKNGVLTLADTWNRDHQPNLAVEMQKAGYETAIVGKWHLHSEPVGFDYYKVLPGQGLYFDPLLKEKGKPWKDANQGGEVHEGHSSDVIGNETLKWLREKEQTTSPSSSCAISRRPTVYGSTRLALRTCIQTRIYQSLIPFSRTIPIAPMDLAPTEVPLAPQTKYGIASLGCSLKFGLMAPLTYPEWTRKLKPVPPINAI